MESLLYAVTEKYAFVFPVANLLGLGKNKIENWNSLPVLPASIFSQLKLSMQHVRAFHHSNNAFLLGHGESRELHCHNDKLQMSEPDFIPPPPISLSDNYFVADIRGKIYLFAHVHSEGFWVLESGTWSSLPAPPLSPVSPTLRLYEIDSPWCNWFVSDDKLFVNACYLPTEVEIVVYDPQSKVWEKMEDKDTYSRLSEIDFGSITTVSVPDVSNNYSVALAFGLEENGDDLYKFKLYALLLDKQTNLVCCRQSLDKCSNEIQPTRVGWNSTNMKFVDLGNRMVCALIFGRAKTKCYGDPEHILSILVFTLAWRQEDQRFVSVVDISVNQVYSTHLYDLDPKDEIDMMHSAFIVTSKKGTKSDFSSAILEQNHSLNWPGDKTKKDSSSTVTNLDRMEVEQENEGRAQPPRIYTMNDTFGELQNMMLRMEGILQSIEANQARQQVAIDNLYTLFGIAGKCGIIPHPHTSQGDNEEKVD